METFLPLRNCLTREIDPAARSEIIRMCETAHQTDFQKLFDYLPEDGLHVIGTQGNQIVAHAVRTTRWAQPEGHPPLKTAYIDAVTTSVAVQGLGFGSALMRSMAEVIRGEDYLLSALETDKPGFYTRLGWEVWRGPLAGRRDGGLVATPEARGQVLILRLPQTPAIDLDSLLTIEDQGRFW
jgi:aminoglycoside 2'-N-acetyltransferase I